ncbi:MAG: protein-disulfide reductase DsbD [Calditrichaeota bacterium]|nr:protein-disulfide reductase DsbD [Calditrichota bacterium]
MKVLRIWFTVLTVLLFTRPNGFAQVAAPAGSEEPLVQVEVKPSLSAVQPGSSMKIAVVLKVREGWHVNAHQTSEDFLLPTVVEFTPVDGVTFSEPVYPKPELQKFSFWEKPIQVYAGKVVIYAEVTVPKDFSADTLVVKGVVHYQGCNDQMCAPPDDVPFKLAVPVVDLSTPVSPVNEDLFQGVELSAAATAAPEENQLAALIGEKGLFVAFLFIFLGGLALNLTPCVYPLIPITVSYFGAQSSSSTGEAFLKSTFYVLGMAVMYSVLGVIAALTGSLFGASLQNPYVLIFVALVFIVLALSMFDVYEIRLPGFLASAASATKGGYFGAFFMGLTVGIVAAPCIGPFILALLAYVGATGNPFLGFWMFFVLALGLGLPYLILGTFSSALSRLPQSGAWMVWVKKIFGFILIGMAIYFLKPLIPHGVYRFLLPALAIVSGIYLGWIERSQSPGTAFKVARWVVGLGAIALGLWLVKPSPAAQGIAWQEYSDQALVQAQNEGKPVIIDFSADWCVACKELEHETFVDPQVVELSKRFVTLRADLTHYGSPLSKKLRERFQIRGLPTVVFLRPDGSEIADLRVIGFIPGSDFAKRMQKALEESTR